MEGRGNYKDLLRYKFSANHQSIVLQKKEKRKKDLLKVKFSIKIGPRLVPSHILD